MNNQIDTNKIPSNERLQHMIIQHNQNLPQTKKQLLFLKRQVDESKQVFRPQSAKIHETIIHYHAPISPPVQPSTSSNLYKNITWLQLRQLQEEIKDNAIWFSEDQKQELVLGKLQAISDRHKQSIFQRHLEKHKAFYQKLRVTSQEDFRRYWYNLALLEFTDIDELIKVADGLLKAKSAIQQAQKVGVEEKINRLKDFLFTD